MIKLADRLAFVKPSPTLAADARAKAMIAAAVAAPIPGNASNAASSAGTCPP